MPITGTPGIAWAGGYLPAGATLAEISAAYEAASMYDLSNDTTMCKQYIQALRFLIHRTKDETRQGSAALRDQSLKYEKQLAEAMAWLRARDTTFNVAATGGVTFADLSEMRA